LRPHGRASVSSSNPRAFGVCDRCGFLYNHIRLQWQFDYAGAGLINKRILVCNDCTDTPQAQLRAIVLPADPVPIQNPRVQDYAAAETDNVTTSALPVYDPVTGIPIPSTTNIITEGGQNMTTQPIGEPVGLDQNAVMPLYNQSAYRVNLNPLSVMANGTAVISVTCSGNHGMSTNDQIAVEGLSVNAANGFYSVTVTSATAFTYEVTSAIPAGSLLQTTTLMVTALVGLPYGYTQIPQTGV
jgi:hypothetical protein